MADQVTAYTFHVRDPEDATRIVTIPRGTPREDVARRFVDALGDADHIWTDAPVRDRGADAFGERDETTGQVERTPVNLSGGEGGDVTPPPRGGEGATADAWRAHARRVGVEVPDDASRDDIIAELDRRGLA